MVSIKESPYEPGCYFVGDQQWKIPPRYRLLKVLGHGSFSFVCLAEDAQSNEKVAIKFVPDVTSSTDYIKRVLRELCILRRISHPGIIQLKDAFVQPSSTGPKRCVGGRLVAESTDLYLVMEYVDGGDLFSLKGQLTELEVRSILLQLLVAVHYLHSINVWHRDLKSANVLITSEGGSRSIKICDFGSARSKSLKEPSSPPMSMGKRRRLHTCDSFARQDQDVDLKDLTVSGTGGQGLQAPLTRTVATPCYRAPEVIMSRGNYSSAIDMWSIGCIFGELLQRIVPNGGNITPYLQVMPLFAVTWEIPLTPLPGLRFGDSSPCNSAIRHELDALFDLVGTPAWSCIESVPSEEWRAYLRRLPGRAPKLHRRLRNAGEVPLDLLARLLTFEPSRRASAEEAMSHEYLVDMVDSEDSPRCQALSTSRGFFHQAPSGLSSMSSAQPMDIMQPRTDSTMSTSGPAVLSLLEAPQMSPQKKDSPHESPMTSPLADRLGSINLTLNEEPSASMGEGSHLEEMDPAHALQLLEDSIEECCMQGTEKEQRQALRKMLEAEVDNIQQHGITHPGFTSRYQPKHRIKKLIKSFSLSEIKNNPLQTQDRFQDSSTIARDRLNYCADISAANVDAEQHLGAGRHGEWSAGIAGRWEPKSSGWGSSTLPPGMEPDSVEASTYLKAISAQQAR